MKPGLTIDKLLEILGPAVKASAPGQHPHDGSRPTPANTLKRPGPLPTPIKPEGEGPSASEIVLGDREP